VDRPEIQACEVAALGTNSGPDAPASAVKKLTLTVASSEAGNFAW
jgi:hypothetical protein